MALHIIIIAGVRNSGVPVESGQEAIDVLQVCVVGDIDYDEALERLQNLQKGQHGI